MAVASAAYDELHTPVVPGCVVLSCDQRPARVVEEQKSRHLLKRQEARAPIAELLGGQVTIRQEAEAVYARPAASATMDL